jgi:hydrophobic/amphiphilic exporter-1 (mainly G- bacteria), HAE1 family
MNLSAIAIKRPVFTTMMTAAVLVLGFLGLSRLGTDLFPDVSFPAIVVNVSYPGAGPTEVENLLTRPIEDAVSGLNGIDRVRSFSREGLAQVWVLFKLGRELDEAANEVRERVLQIRYRFPEDAADPTVGRLDVSAAPIVTYTLQGGGSLSTARKFADDVLKPELEQVDGVASLNVQGGGVREITVELNRTRLEALNLTAGDVAQRLRAENVNVPAGRFDEGAREISVRTIGEFGNVEAIRNVIVATAPDGSTVRLRDIANVVDGFEEARTLARVNGREAVTFDVVKRSGQNTVAVADAVAKKLEELKPRFPKGVELALIVDQPRFIRDSVRQVEHDLVFGGAMAVLVILFFMLDLRSTLISATALPTSIIGTFFIIWAAGYTLNMMTLLALSLSIGLLIDDAVVVRENIFKHLERGASPMQAAIQGTKEIALVVFATTATVIAVFLPVAFVPGMVGQFFRQFGYTVIAAVVLSMFVAFTLDPMLSSRFSKALTPGDHQRESFAGLKRPFRWFFSTMEATYRVILRWSLGHKLVVGGLAIGSLFFIGFLMSLTGNDFVNPEDRGQFVVEVELPSGASLAETSRASAIAEEEFRKHPQMRTLFSTIGPLGEVNKARWRVVTSPKHERTQNLEQLKMAARAAVKKTLPDAKVVVTDIPFVEGAMAEAPVMINVRGGSYEDILPVARKIEGILRTTGGLADVNLRYSPGRPELQVEIDRTRAAERGLAVAPLAMSLRAAMEGSDAGRLRQGEDETPIKVRLSKDDRTRPEALGNILLPTPKGQVRLGDVANFVRGEGPQVVERENRSKQVQIWATPVGRPLGDIVKDIQPQIAEIKLPVGTSIFYDGFIRLMNENNEGMATALLLGVLFIFIILASQFESFIHPLTIMLTLPLAIIGAIMGLFLSRNSLAMGALIGIILLMGLVTKNAILLIDRAIVRVRDHGDNAYDAILEAGPQRLRPILMTSAAMVLGMLPTAISNSEGSEFRAPMAIAVIGGVVSSTFLSLVVVPVFYLAIENGRGRLNRLFRRGKRPVSISGDHRPRRPTLDAPSPRHPSPPSPAPAE